MKHSQSFAGFNHSTRFKFHAPTAGNRALVGLADSFMSNGISSPGNQDGSRFIQRDQGFDISPVEGVEEKSVDFGWSVSRHTFIALPDAAAP